MPMIDEYGTAGTFPTLTCGPSALRLAVMTINPHVRTGGSFHADD